MDRVRRLHVVITGASSGVGQATAEAFAAQGAKLVLAARNATALREVALRCHAAGGRAIVVPTDVTDARAVQALVRHASGYLGRIDVWFSNAGIGVVGRLHEVPPDLQAQVIRTNLIGHLNDAHAVLPVFIRQAHGIFINMISAGGLAAAPYAASYSASKFGLRALSESLRAELRDWRDIHVCDVYPTFIDTPGLAHAGNYTGYELSAPPPLLDPRSVAKAIVRLAHRPRHTLVLGAPGPLLRLIPAFAPNVVPRALRRLMDVYFRRAASVPRTVGNLYRPKVPAGGIDGGLRRRRRPRYVAYGAIGASALAATLLLVRYAAPPRRTPLPADRLRRS
jgi:NADP-dependent 3-hydroxy acid dehydrogenase YdfG